MRLIDIATLTETDIHFDSPEVFPETWAKRHAFSLYKELPRPTSALFLIVSELTAVFTEASGVSVTAHRGDIVYIPQGVRYHVRIPCGGEGTTDTYTVNFNLLDREGERLLLSKKIMILSHTRDNTAELHAAALCRALRSVGAERRNLLRIRAEFYALIDAALSSASTDTDRYYPIRIGAEALRAEWNQNERMEKYAALCGISNAYFYRCFRAWSGKSPVEYRNLLRLNAAEAMLRETDMRVSDISEAVGYEDPFYFCRIFSRHYGSSPQNYRKANRSPSIQ